MQLKVNLHCDACGNELSATEYRGEETYDMEGVCLLVLPCADCIAKAAKTARGEGIDMKAKQEGVA